ncbi:MAG: hypothetical protein H6819_03615 [Phycisphaerales bacterium]|nr:hypothetical protein [Phycisphaerales bacterium]MCB9856285.1 hypothetical protein [Phycisphaerales bacterium]MCB9863276.1 hypothetical protein [Phycisphaerales bacterium]
MQALSRRSRAALILLTFVAGSLRVAYPIKVGSYGKVFDETHLEYVVAGRRLVLHGEYLSPWPADDDTHIPSSIMPPAYTGLIAATYACLGIASKASTLFLQFLNIIASTAVVPLVFATTRRLADSKAAWIAAIVVCVNPLMIGFCDYMWDTSIFSLLVTLAAYLAVRLSQTEARPVSMGLLGLTLGAIALVNPALTIAYPILVLWPLTRRKPIRMRRVVAGVTASVIGFAVAIAPWTARNYLVLDRAIYIRNGLGLQLWLGVCPGVESMGDQVWQFHYPMRNANLSGMTDGDRRSAEMAYIDQCRRDAVAAILADPVRWIRLCGERASDFWLGTVITHSGPAIVPYQPQRLFVTLFSMFEIVSILLMILWCRRIPRNAGWLIACCVLFSIVYCMTITMMRFRSPIEPLVAIVLALSVRSAWTRMRGHRNGDEAIREYGEPERIGN